MYLPNEKQSEFIFYVYAYLRIDGTPYYIGKGSNNRAYEKHKNRMTPKDRCRITIIENNLSELGAFAIERRMICWYGRKDIGTGILRNRTAGGEGSSGYRLSTPRSEEYRIKISIANKGKEISEEHKLRLSVVNTGKHHSNETRDKISKTLTGKILSEETKEKIRQANIGRKDDSRYVKMGQTNKGRTLSPEWITKCTAHTIGSKWWNNGLVSKRSKTSPGNDFILGRI